MSPMWIYGYPSYIFDEQTIASIYLAFTYMVFPIADKISLHLRSFHRAFPKICCHVARLSRIVQLFRIDGLGRSHVCHAHDCQPPDESMKRDLHTKM